MRSVWRRVGLRLEILAQRKRYGTDVGGDFYKMCGKGSCKNRTARGAVILGEEWEGGVLTVKQSTRDSEREK